MSLALNELGYFEARGLNILAFSNWYDGLFSDAKISGIEIIQQDVRTATNGDVRLSPTPAQWDPVPQLIARDVQHEGNRVETTLAYAEYNFQYKIVAETHGAGIRLAVELDQPLPQALEGRAGFNLEFLPAAYFGKSYLVDGKGDIFPRYPTGPMGASATGVVEPKPFASGSSIVLAPEDSSRHVTIKALQGELLLFDGRNMAQNGWYVVRSLLPAAQAGRVVEWFVTATIVPGWLRPPVIAHSQLGYHPHQPKIAVIELDKNDRLVNSAEVLKITESGEFAPCFVAEPQSWGKYLRYNYATFDFSAVQDEGLYTIHYGGVRTHPFRIAANIYGDAWHPTLDVFFPVQMDHMFVREAYRVWHGVPHLDDARQALVNHEHFDLYAQGSSTDTPYGPGEHIPGLDIGGWFDAGDFDIRTQTQYVTLLDLVQTWESFHIQRDETTVDQQRRHVEIHVPDGIPDLLQQIEHGTLALIAQHRAVGHAIAGIVEPDLVQYAHLGDASTKTDNLIYSPDLQAGETDGSHSGTPDDRWAFTTASTALNYGSAAALAAASRALYGYRDELAAECLATATRVWDEEHAHPPVLFHHGNTTGGDPEEEELNAALELLICTQDPRYSRRIDELWPVVDRNFAENAALVVRALPYMSADFARRLRARVSVYSQQRSTLQQENPFAVPIATSGWAGSGVVIRFAITQYMLHKSFPDLVDASAIFRGLDYIYGCHPGSDISFVSAVGTVSKEVAYGNNRADFSFIAGGIVPGVLILKPDFPENKEDWPFFWGENEYVVNLGASYLFLVNAVNELLNGAGEVL